MRKRFLTLAVIAAIGESYASAVSTIKRGFGYGYDFGHVHCPILALADYREELRHKDFALASVQTRRKHLHKFYAQKAKKKLPLKAKGQQRR